MITPQELRKVARMRRLPLDLIEKDYALGWILIAVSSSSLSDKLIFKGGTALSKVYFPFGWRLSEDLDFTIAERIELSEIESTLSELTAIVEAVSGGLTLSFKDEPYVNPGFIRVRAQFGGLIAKNTVKIEVSSEAFIGDFQRVRVASTYDYPEFSVLTYSLNNILAEKLRAIIERGFVRDYYDVWRLLKIGRFEPVRVRELFLEKCKGKGVVFLGVEHFFPEGVENRLEPYFERSLARLSSESLPSIGVILSELRMDVSDLFGEENNIL